MHTDFDLADGTVIGFCVRYTINAEPVLCPPNDEQLSGQAVDDLVDAVGKGR